MTRDEILNMPAGREMDVTIGYHVMDLGAPPGVYPEYSTDIAAAWEVVEKANVSCIQQAIGDTPDELLWFACCGDASTACDTEAFAETAPLAICRAALLAVMEAS
jgi:hypothetical protein